MPKLEREDSRWLLMRLVVVVCIILASYLIISLGLKLFNKTLGLERVDGGAEEEPQTLEAPRVFYTPEDRVALPEIEALPEGPEAAWEMTPCSLWVPGSSQPVVDSIPEAPSVEHKPLEAFFLVRRWAMESGMDEEDAGMVFVFTRLDTIYVDLPVERELEGLKRTIESRFICFTRLFPLVAGNLRSAYPEGISLRGIEGVFRN